MKQGQAVDDIQKMGMESKLEAMLRFSAQAKHRVGKSLVGQALAAFLEITEKKTRGEINGGR